MADLLTSLGVMVGWAFVFKPILEDLAKEASKDFAKDFCKGALKHVMSGKDEWKKATLKALKEFLEQFEQELIGAGEVESLLKGYTESLNAFTKLETVRASLGQAITSPDQPIDSVSLAKSWKELNLQCLPAEFDWSKLSRRYQSKAREILRSSDELRKILDSIALESIAKASRQAVGVPPGFDTSKYAEGLRKRYGYLKLESLDANPDHQRIALTKLFVEQTVRSCDRFNPKVYEIPIEHRYRLKEKGAIDVELKEEEIRRQQEAFLSQASIPVLDVVNEDQQRLNVILGDPGSGKSVLLEYVALIWAELPLAERIVRPIPLLIELKTYADNYGRNACRDFLEFLDHGGGSIGQLDGKELDNLLDRGDAMILLDGLDEVFDHPIRKQIAHDLVRFTTRYPKARFVITSRVIGYDLVASILRDAGFQQFLLQPLDERQQEIFVRRWHELAYTDSEERAEKSYRLRDSIFNVVAIRELAKNPLMLTLMALLNRHQELPRNKSELFEEASKLMLQQWDASKALRDDPLLDSEGLSYKDKQALLRAVAFAMQTNSKGLAGNIISTDELSNIFILYLNAQCYANPRPIAVRLIQQLRERNFILCLLGDDYFCFVHRTFLEFFCAGAWIWKFEKGEKNVVSGNWERISIEELGKQTFEAHWKDEKWSEVLCLIAASINAQLAGKLVETLLASKSGKSRAHRLLLAARCFSGIRNNASLTELTKSLDRQLKSLVNRMPGYEDLAIQYPDDYDAVDYDDTVHFTTEWRSDGEEGRPVAVGAQAVHAVAACWPRMLSTKNWLVSLVTLEMGRSVISAAVHEVARGWRNDSGTLVWLKDVALNHKHGSVRELAIQGIARSWREWEDAAAWLLERGRYDSDFNVRIVCARELAMGWRDDPRFLPWLKARVKYFKGVGLAFQVMREIARNSKDDASCLRWLNSISKTENDWVLQSAASHFANLAGVLGKIP